MSEESRAASCIRLAEAKATLPGAAGLWTGAGVLAVGCPFCLPMLNDASKADGGTVKVLDVAERPK